MYSRGLSNIQIPGKTSTCDIFLLYQKKNVGTPENGCDHAVESQSKGESIRPKSRLALHSKSHM